MRWIRNVIHGICKPLIYTKRYWRKKENKYEWKTTLENGKGTPNRTDVRERIMCMPKILDRFLVFCFHSFLSLCISVFSSSLAIWFYRLAHFGSHVSGFSISFWNLIPFMAFCYCCRFVAFWFYKHLYFVTKFVMCHFRCYLYS